MNGWIVFAVWILGVIATWRSFTMSVLIGAENAHPRIDSEDRAICAVVGLMIAATWPVALIIRAGWRVLRDRTFLLTPHEKAAAEKAELEALRRQAREYGLPMPKDNADA